MYQSDILHHNEATGVVSSPHWIHYKPKWTNEPTFEHICVSSEHNWLRPVLPVADNRQHWGVSSDQWELRSLTSWPIKGKNDVNSGSSVPARTRVVLNTILNYTNFVNLWCKHQYLVDKNSTLERKAYNFWIENTYKGWQFKIRH